MDGLHVLFARGDPRVEQFGHDWWVAEPVVAVVVVDRVQQARVLVVGRVHGGIDDPWVVVGRDGLHFVVLVFVGLDRLLDRRLDDRLLA